MAVVPQGAQPRGWDRESPEFSDFAERQGAVALPRRRQAARAKALRPDGDARTRLKQNTLRLCRATLVKYPTPKVGLFQIIRRIPFFDEDGINREAG